MTLYEIRDGRIGAASIAFGPKGGVLNSTDVRSHALTLTRAARFARFPGEGGLEDATGAGGAGGAGYQQTSKTVNLIKGEEEKKKEGIWGIKLEFPWMVRVGTQTAVLARRPPGWHADRRVGTQTAVRPRPHAHAHSHSPYARSPEKEGVAPATLQRQKTKL